LIDATKLRDWLASRATSGASNADKGRHLSRSDDQLW
jgi:hypothetical protein